MRDRAPGADQQPPSSRPSDERGARSHAGGGGGAPRFAGGRGGAPRFAGGIQMSAIAVGDRAPDFTLRRTLDESVRLADLLVQGPVVLFFYVFDFGEY